MSKDYINPAQLTDEDKKTTHELMFDGLNCVTGISMAILGSVHVIAGGLDYYLTQAYQSAPNKAEANKFINEVLKRAKEENNG